MDNRNSVLLRTWERKLKWPACRAELGCIYLLHPIPRGGDIPSLQMCTRDRMAERAPTATREAPGGRQEVPGATAVRDSPDTPVCSQPAAIITARAEMKDKRKWDGA